MEAHTIANLAGRVSGVSVDRIQVTVRAPLAHQSNRLYDIYFDQQHWIAKEYLNEDEFADAPRREYESLRLVASLDIAPTPIHYEPCSDYIRPIVLYHYMQGAMWDRRAPTESDLSRLAQVWLTMHQVEKNGLWLSRGQETSLGQALLRIKQKLHAYRDWAQQFYVSGIRAADWGLEILKKRETDLAVFSGMKQELVFSRADPRFANVIERTEGTLGYVDWEDAGLRDPARDLADMMIHPNQEDLVSENLWQAFFDPYYAEREKYDPQIKERTHLYYGGASLVWYAGLLDFGVRRASRGDLPGWQINGIPANQRLRRYLARCWAWPDGNLDDELETLSDFCFFPE